MKFQFYNGPKPVIQGNTGSEVSNNNNRRSNLTQEVLSKKPDAVETWAIPLFLLLLVIIVTSSNFIRFPEVVKIPIKLVNTNTIPDIYKKTSGNNYCAKITLPQADYGKVRIGQRVIISLDAYPSRTFGSINGRLRFLSNTVTENGIAGYIAVDDIPNDRVKYMSGLTGSATIVVKDATLFKKILSIKY